MTNIRVSIQTDVQEEKENQKHGQSIIYSKWSQVSEKMHKKAEDGGLRPNIKMSHILMRYPSSHFRLIWHLCYNDLFIIITLYRNIKLCSEEWDGR